VVSWLLDQDRSGTLQGLVHIGLFRCTLAPPSLQALCTDAGDADEFIWADGTPFVPGTSYEAWADDQPSTATWTLIDPEARRYGISPNNDPGWVMGFADYWGLCQSVELVYNCHPLASCTDAQGNFTCSCNAGYSGDGVASCVDVDECALGTHDCGCDGTCINNIGGFTCAPRSYALHQTSTAAINHVPFCEAMNMTLATIFSQVSHLHLLRAWSVRSHCMQPFHRRIKTLWFPGFSIKIVRERCKGLSTLGSFGAR